MPLIGSAIEAETLAARNTSSLSSWVNDSREGSVASSALRIRTSSPVAVRVVNGTTQPALHARTGAPVASLMPLVTWIRYVVASRRNPVLMPARTFVCGSNVSWPSAIFSLPRLRKKSDALTDLRSMVPVNGTTTRGCRSNPVETVHLRVAVADRVRRRGAALAQPPADDRVVAAEPEV